MNIVFFGTSEFAVPSLKAILKSKHKVLAVVTQPDRKKGRDLKLSPPYTKVLALAEGIPVYQPEDASSKESVEYLKKLSADLFVVISFGQILKADVLAIPKIYSINFHASLLPKYRGAAPTNWAVINGDKSSGVTVIKMNERMDEGDIILRRETEIDPEDTNITLSQNLSQAGAGALPEAIELIECGKARLEKQDGSRATYAPKLKKEDGLIDWSESAVNIHNKVRGLIPWPGAYTYYDKKVLKILKTKLIDNPGTLNQAVYGEVLDIQKDGSVIVKTGSGVLAIKALQLEGKKALDPASFILGHKLAKGYKFTSINMGG